MPLSQPALAAALKRSPAEILAAGARLVGEGRVSAVRRLVGQLQGDVTLESGGSARVTIRPGTRGPSPSCTCPDGRSPGAAGERWCAHIAAVLKLASEGRFFAPSRGASRGLTSRVLNRTAARGREGRPPVRRMSAAVGPLADPSVGKRSGGEGRGRQTAEARLAQAVRRHAPARVWLASKELIQRDAVVQWRWQGSTLGGELRERGRAPLSAWVELTGEMPHPGCVCDEGAGGGWCAHSVAVARVAAIQAAAEAAGLSTGGRVGSGEGGTGGARGSGKGEGAGSPRRGGPAALRFLLFRKGRDLVVEIQEARGAAVRDLGRLLEASRLAAAGIAEESDRYRRGGSHGASPFRPADLAVLQLLGRFGRRGSGSARITIDLDRASELLGRLLDADDAFGPLGGPLRQTPSPPFLQLSVTPGRTGRSLCKALWRVPGLEVKAGEPVRVLAYRGGSSGEGHLLAGDLAGAVADELVRLASGLPPNGREMPDEELARQLEGVLGNPLPPGVQVLAATAGPHRVGPAKAPDPVLAVARRGERIRMALAFDYGDARARPAPEAIEFSARRRGPGGERVAGEQARAELLRRSPTRFAAARRKDHTLWMPRDAGAELALLLAVAEGGLVPEVGGSFVCEESTLIELAAAGGDRWRGCRVEGSDALADFAVSRDQIELDLTIAGARGGGLGADESAGMGAAGWFEMELHAAAGDERIDPLLLLRLMGEGKEYVPLARGGRARIPTEELLRLNEMFEAAGAEAEAAEGVARFRARNTSLGLVGQGDETGPRVRFEDRELRLIAEGLSGSGTGFRGRADEREGGMSKLPEAPIPPGLKATLRDYQREGYRWLRFLATHRLGGVLADDMGLGKTVQTLTLLLHLRESLGPGPNLVVAPSSVVMGWAAEAARFAPELRVLALTGPRRWRDDPDPAEFDLVLTSYALLRRDALRLSATSWRIVVFDEAQFLKNLATRSASAARLLKARARFALSGTPVENRLTELFAIYDLVLPGMLGRHSDFLDIFDRPIAAGGEAGARSAARLHERIRPYLMRRLKTEVLKELPSRTEVELPVELLPGQSRLYTEVLRTVRGEVFGRVDAEGIGRATIHVLAALTRLRQIACDPRLLGDEVPPALRGSAKLQVLKGMLPELVSEGHAALIFSQFTSFLDHVETTLEELGLRWLRLDGSTPTAKRPALVEAFQAEDGPPLFLIGLKAGGTGLNLTRADYVFHLDPWWNPAVEDQATDRAHRIGQTRPVVAYRLVASGTVESRIRLMQERKRDLAAAVLGGDEGRAAGLDRDDLELLFGE